MSRPSLEFPAAGISDDAIRLRLLAEADLPALIEAVQDPEIPRWTRIPEGYDERDAREWMDRQAQARNAGAMLSLVIVDTADDRLLGAIGINELDWEEERCELGYWTAREQRRRGVMSRALRLLSGWIFETLPIERIAICADVENTPSRRVAERAGFSFEGILRSHTVIKGARRDMASYSLLRGELR